MAGTTDFELNPARLVSIMRSFFHARDRVVVLSDDQYILSQKVAWETAVSKNLLLPGLVGFWPMSSVQRSTGDAYDLSGQGRTMAYNGNPTYSIYNDFVPYIALDGTGDFLNRPDETDLDVQGNETIYASNVRGLTMGGWFRAVDGTPATNERLMAKFGVATIRSFELRHVVAGNIRAFISENGSATFSIPAGNTVEAGVWFHCVMRFIPSVELAIFFGGEKDTNTTAPPSSIFNSAAAFTIGAANLALTPFNGDITLCFLCANALSDALLDAKFQQERRLFGV